MSRAPWLTRSQVDRIARLLQDGATSREIVRLMGVSAGTVSNVRMGKISGKRSHTPATCSTATSVLRHTPGTRSPDSG